MPKLLTVVKPKLVSNGCFDHEPVSEPLQVELAAPEGKIGSLGLGHGQVVGVVGQVDVERLPDLGGVEVGEGEGAGGDLVMSEDEESEVHPVREC